MKHIVDEPLVDELVSKLKAKHSKQEGETSFPTTGSKSGFTPEAERVFPQSGDKSGTPGPESDFPPSGDKSGVTGE